MRGQGERSITVLPMTGQGALIYKELWLCVRRREGKPLDLKNRKEQRIMTIIHNVIHLTVALGASAIQNNTNE